MKSELYFLSQDLLKLYSKTKVSKVEDLYLKTAASVGTTDLKGLLTNPEYQKQFKNLRPLGNKVPNAILWLIDYAGSGTGVVENIAASIGSSGTKLPKGFARIKDICQDVLPAVCLEAQPGGGFNVLLNYVSAVAKRYYDAAVAKFPAAINAGVPKVRTYVKLDLNTIQGWLMGSTEEEREYTPEESVQAGKMYSMLLEKFSAELQRVFMTAAGTAAVGSPEAREYTQVARLIQGGALADSNQFKGVLDLQVNQITYQAAEEVVNIILRRTDDIYFNQNVEIIKRKALGAVGARPKPQPVPAGTPPNLLQQIQKNPDVAKGWKPTALTTPPTSAPGTLPIAVVPTPAEFKAEQERKQTTVIPDEQWMYPSVISMLCVIFTIMKTKIYGQV